MSLMRLSHVCSHLQNASRARLGLTSVPSSALNLAVLLQLQQQGFISSVTRAGPYPPQLMTDTSLPHASDPNALDPDHPDSAIVTQANVASRRLWLGLKYWKQRPVLSEMHMVSRPRQKIWLGYRDLESLVLGRDARFVKGLTKTGECLLLSTHKGVLEARECVNKEIGGMALCRVV